MREYDQPPTRSGWLYLVGGVVVGLVILAGLLTHGFGLAAPGKSETVEEAAYKRDGERIIVPENSPLRQRLSVAPVASRAVDARLILPAVVEADPARTAAVLSPLAGRVTDIKVALGDRVRKGQVLAVIDSPDLAQALDDDEKAADTLELADKTLKRQVQQAAIGAAAARDLDQARSDRAQAQAEYTRTQARLAVIDAKTEGGPKSRLLAIKAPIGGSVTAVTIAPGNMINDPTQPLMTVSDLGTVWVTALVAEKDVGAVARDQEAEVALVAYPDRPLHGKVLFVGDVIEPDTRRDKLRIADYALKPNMFATETLLAPKRDLVVLPTSALLMNNDRTTIFVATAPWTFERRAVQPRLEEGDTVAIESGVRAGEQVVVKGGILLND
jgi:cobalt-zinc-cadmium efflux system membrane fusion protein